MVNKILWAGPIIGFDDLLPIIDKYSRENCKTESSFFKIFEAKMSSGMSHMYIYLIEHKRQCTVSSSRCAQDIFP